MTNAYPAPTNTTPPPPGGIDVILSKSLGGILASDFTISRDCARKKQ